LTPDGQGMPAPYRTVDNEDSFLDASDLVFIDAISTGYSRPVAGQTPSQFYGIIEDANYFADFIYQYLNRAERWASPKFLIGESYGTTRSAELAGVLQEKHQIYLNGIVLVSSVAFSDVSGDDRNAFFLPTMTATAWYHHKLPNQPAELPALLKEVEGKIQADGTVLDSASPHLHRLRREIEKQKKGIQESLERFLRANRNEGVLQEEYITIRNDRYVVPVISGQRRKLPGVIHGASSTGQTLFLDGGVTAG